MSSNDLVNSAIATFVAELTTLPICTVKTCYQTQNNSNSIVATTRNIYQTHGLRGFYKASVPALGAQVISTSSKYFFYRFYEQKLFPENSNLRQKMFAGWLSGVTSTLITHPLDFFRVKLQSSLSNEPYVPIKTEFKTNGLKVLYRGYSKSFSKVSVGSLLFYPLTDQINEYTDNIVVASASSAIISTTLMHPLDYLKTRHLKGGLKLYSTNPLVYYTGLSLNLMRIVPHFTITMSIISFLGGSRQQQQNE